MLPIGKRTVEFFARNDVEMLTTEFAEAASVSVADCFTISNLVTQGYLSGQYDEVSVVYTRFVSMLTQTPAQDSLLPLEKLEAKGRIFVIRPEFDGAGRVERDEEKLNAFYRHGYEYMKAHYDQLLSWLEKKPEEEQR